jgi:transposase
MLRRQGYRIRTGGVMYFEKRVREAEVHEQLRKEIEPLFAVMRELNVQIKALDEQLEQEARDDEVAERLRTVPGIGPVTALFFISVVDDVRRFESAHKLAAYLGLVPRELSSGEKRYRGRITKAGNCRLRWLLVEAAWRILWRPTPETEHLIRWTNRIAARRGKNVAAVALARRLSGILYAMWRDGTCFALPVRNSKEDLAA